mmetsp:Transcript_18491/g.33330  ORF Transcript_18491/g.33330 Transcript_18491/m.33330 type:complete len:217 (+) Transcript_18491:1335-1985(+)
MEGRFGEFKIILLGCTEVGKTSLISRYVKNRFTLNSSASVFSHDVAMKTVLFEGETYTLKIVDTSGQERYDSIPRSYYRDVTGAFLIFDITNFKTFENLKKWRLRLKEYCAEAPIILVGNKKDMPCREVPEEVASSFARRHRINYMETSALNGEGVQVAFERMVEIAVKRLKHQMASSQKSFAYAMSQLDSGTSILLSPEPKTERKIIRKKSSNCC